MRDQESAPIEKQLRVLSVTLDYPPPLSGGYGVMCAQVCTWLKQRGHEVLVLTALPQEPGIDSADPDAEECAVSVLRFCAPHPAQLLGRVSLPGPALSGGAGRRPAQPGADAGRVGNLSPRCRRLLAHGGDVAGTHHDDSAPGLSARLRHRG